jgi:hypothetical protein
VELFVSVTVLAPRTAKLAASPSAIGPVLVPVACAGLALANPITRTSATSVLMILNAVVLYGSITARRGALSEKEMRLPSLALALRTTQILVTGCDWIFLVKYPRKGELQHD